MMRSLLMLGLALVLLMACAPTETEPTASETEPEATPTGQPALAPVEQEQATSAASEDDEMDEPETETVEPDTQLVAPVTVDLQKLTPVPPVDTTPREMPAPGVPGDKHPMVEKVSLDLSERLDVDDDEIKLIKMEQVEWSDSSLGCPEPGAVYMQVITPGYLIILEVEGKLYEYHTDQNNIFVLCEGSRPMPVGTIE